MTISTCACGWSTNTNEQGGRLLCVLHVLVRHPALYREATGRDPEAAAHVYREALSNPELRSVL